MEQIKMLPAPKYTKQEREALTHFLLALRKSYIQEFLSQLELPKSGSKPDLRERVQEALSDGDLTYERLVDFLDTVVPWGKQHVFLYRGPQQGLRSWRDPNYVQGLLKQHRLGKLFNARLPLVLPEKLSLSSITHSNGRLRVSAIQKKEYAERTPEHDEERETTDGERITLTAHVHHLTRTIVSFEWDLNANVAILQITQLKRAADYDEVAKEFFQLISSWLDIQRFRPFDLRRVIRKLHELEGNGSREIRSHGIQYRTLRGRRVAVQSPSRRDSVLGEPHIDSALTNVRKNGLGHLANCYWLPQVQSGPVNNPLRDEVHVILVGAESRVNFPTPNTEDEVRYVLHRVRELS